MNMCMYVFNRHDVNIIFIYGLIICIICNIQDNSIIGICLNSINCKNFIEIYRNIGVLVTQLII